MPVQISRVTAEHYARAVGIAERAPRLSWRFTGHADSDKKTKSGWTQSAYEVSITRGPLGGATKDETKRVESEASLLVDWPFAPLAPREGAHVRVRAHGTDGATDWAEVYIEAAPDASDLDAAFISGEAQDVDAPKRPFRVRRTFTASVKDGKPARIYATAMGVYELYLNGERIGDELLAPGWQSYEHRLAFQTYDVSALLRDGENVLSAWVAEGWYSGRLGWFHTRNFWGSRLGLMLQLEVGSEAVVKTDKEWEWSYGALSKSELYDGETRDVGVDDEKWKVGTGKGKGDGEWCKVQEVKLTSAKLVPAASPPVREVETFQVVQVITTPSGKTILDFGQNFAGYIKILKAPPASTTEIVLSHAEVLERDELGVRPLRTAKPVDRIIVPQGKHAELVGHTPKFTFHGFRYAQVEGWEGIAEGDVEGVAIQTSMERTGTFECDHKLINRLHKNVVSTLPRERMYVLRKQTPR